MRILITGATGFIGGRLCDKLVREGHTVRALVRDARQCAPLRQRGVEPVLGNLLDGTSLQAATSGSETVFHFAAVFRKEVPRREIWQTNVTGIENLLDAAAQSAVGRFVHCSSTSVYGLTPKTPTTELSPTVPIPEDLYQESKLAAEERVSRYRSTGNAATIVRTTGVYGPGDLRFLKLFKAIRRKLFVMLGDGEVPFSMIYIDDFLDGIVRSAFDPNGRNNDFLLTGNNPITLNKTVEILAGACGVQPPRLHVPVMPFYYAGLVMEHTLKPLGISPPLHRRRVNFFRITRGFDNSKAKRQLGFNPRIDLAAGARQTVDWYRSNGFM
jgi:nucleoside-diphosphate-sugar epimerase